MHLTAVILGFCVFGQVSGDTSTPAELVAEALVSPPQSRLQGRPLTLLAAVSAATDRRRQIEVTHAYWRLVEAVADYHVALDHDDRLRELQPGEGELATLRAAQASSSAMLHEVEAAVVMAQHELAALVSFSPDTPLPLPADPPHVGSYRTGFDQLFSSGNASSQARRIDQTLPIRRRAIEARALAVQAARDARAEAVHAHELGHADLAAVLASMTGCLQQRRALMASVCRYNEEIADYALALAAPGIEARALVAMLIKPAPDSAVRPAGHFAPVPTPARRPGENEPTPAKRPEDPHERVPTPAKRPDGPKPNEPTPAERPQEDSPTSASQWSASSS